MNKLHDDRKNGFNAKLGRRVPVSVPANTVLAGDMIGQDIDNYAEIHRAGVEQGAGALQPGQRAGE